MSSKPTTLSIPGGDSHENFEIKKDEPVLSKEETTEAMKELNVSGFPEKFRNVERRFCDPSLVNQQIGLVSFIPAKGATPNEKGIYGFAKLRGNFNSEDEANERAEHLIQNVDSAHLIYHTLVGRPFPLTVDPSYAAETSEVDIRKDTQDSVSQVIKNTKKQDKKAMEEIEQRERELMEDVAKVKQGDEIEEDEYVTNRVKKAQLSWTYTEYVSKLKEVRKKILEVRDWVNKADEDYPEFKESYFQKYRSARERAGLTFEEDDIKQGFMKFLVEDVYLPGVDDDMEIEQVYNVDEKDMKATNVSNMKVDESKSTKKKSC